MKKSLLALVIASALPLSAFAEVVVYGKANVSLQQADENDESQLELVSNASRIGVKGSEDISSGLKAIYQFEYQTEVDDGDKDFQTFNQRNIYIGLQGDFGTAMAGHFDTPTKVAQEKVDLFNDLEGDIKNIVAPDEDESIGVNGEYRASNIVQYTTPTFADAFAINVAFVAAENGEEADDGIATSLTYTTSAFYAAVAFEQDVAAQDVDILRVVGRYTVGALQLGAIYENVDGLDVVDFGGGDIFLLDVENDTYVVSAKYSLNDQWALKAQYGDLGGEIEQFVDIGADTLSLGVDHYLSKNATIFAYYTENSAEFDSNEYAEGEWLGVGMELKF